jgi:nucleotidyltransferase substrate binding protein (TIGR01987 family)
MENLDVRWKQRFANFENAFKVFKIAIKDYENPSDLEKEGTVQRFEFTHELAWKVMKDFLLDKGLLGIIGSKDATRLAFQNEIIEDGQIWMDMIDSRNKTVYTYHGNILDVEYHKIKNIYFPLIEKFNAKMKTFL